MPHMQRGGRAIVADIGRQAAFQRRRVDPGEVRALVNIAALGEDPQEIGADGGFSRGHDWLGSQIFASGGVGLQGTRVLAHRAR